MKRIALCMLLISLAVPYAGCHSEKAPLSAPESKIETKELTVSAAASLKDCLTEIEAIYAKSSPNTKVLLNFGASGSLQHQIEQGAPVDIFISAGEKQIDALEAKDLLIANSRSSLLMNSVVLIAPKNSSLTSIQELATDKVKKVAYGEPTAVPAGQYADESLDFYKLKEKISDKVVFTKDVREVLTWVENENVDAGFVFKTDALVSDKVKVITELTEESHSPVVYPIAIIKATKEESRAKAFTAFLKSDQAKIIFEKYGFGMAK